MNKLLILSDWYFPAYKAGGPITALVNLVELLRHKINITILTSAYDLGEREKLKDIIPDIWQHKENITIKYISEPKSAAEEIINQNYDFIFLNSMFAFNFTVRPLFFAKRKKILHKIILSPRGMLQRGALSQKKYKKKIFLLFFRLSGIANKIQFHATDEQEKKDIEKTFLSAKQITIIPDVVTKYAVQKKLKRKDVNKLNLVYLSVISSKKNLRFLIEIFQQIKYHFELDIIGSIKDKSYWNSFYNEIKKINNINIKYLGDVRYDLVHQTLSNYDFFILPTLGENFGHAIYEALSTGTPVIISDKTPWKNLEKLKAGWDIPLDKPERFIEVLQKCVSMGNEEYQLWSNGAYNFAKRYYEENDLSEKYLRMFGMV